LPRNRSHYRIKLNEVLLYHDLTIFLFGGRDGIRDLGAIESAIARPYCGYYRSIDKKAAALLQSLACNHGFIDGNKRTALVALNLMLTRSGYRLSSKDEAQLNIDMENMILDLVERRVTFDEVVAWFKQRIVPYGD
jgi:death on curing protein